MTRLERSALRSILFALAVLLPGAVDAQANLTLTFEDAIGGTGGEVELPVILSFGGTENCGGYSVGVCVDPAVVSSVAVSNSIPTFEVHFIQVGIIDEGWTVGVVFNHDAPGGLSPGTHEVCRLIGEVTAPAPTSTTIDSCLIGDPVPVSTVAVFLGQSFVPVVVPGTLTIGTGLRRGDTNDDGVLNIADAITLWAMFSPSTTAPPVTCDDAADANDDGQIDVADVVTILAYLFQDGSIPAPLEGCGPDETSDALDCAQAGNC